MRRILIHVHIYYVEMWPELKVCLKNILTTAKCRLYVTMVEPRDDLFVDIKTFCPEAVVDVLENRGFDIAPFIHVLNKVDLSDFDYIVKLHTKRNIITKSFMFNGFDLSGDKWRQYLLNFCKTFENWRKTLDLLAKDNITMVSDYHLISDADKSIDVEALKTFEQRLGLSYYRHQKFVSGTMFAAKAEIFSVIQYQLMPTEFRETSRSGMDLLPYLCEVVFGCLASKGTIVSFDGKHAFLRKCCVAVARFFFRHKVTPKKEIIKIFGIPIYRKKLK